NYPHLHISPIITKSIESIEGETSYLGDGLFRRVFKIYTQAEADDMGLKYVPWRKAKKEIGA
ncbi:hypothetical protein LCGC14_0961020, partial [marine sediment metagenome]